MKVFTIMKLSLMNFMLVILFGIAAYFLFEAFMLNPYRHMFGILQQTEIDIRFLGSFLVGVSVIVMLVNSKLKSNSRLCIGLCLVILGISYSATFIVDPKPYQEEFAYRSTEDFLKRYPNTDEAKEIRGYLETKDFDAIAKFSYLRTFYIEKTIQLASYVATYNTPAIESEYRKAIADGYINIPEEQAINTLVEREILRRIKNL